MNSQLNYLIAQQHIAELACRAEQARRAVEARAVSAPSPRGNLRRLLASRRLRTADLAAAAHRARPGAPKSA